MGRPMILALRSVLAAVAAASLALPALAAPAPTLRPGFYGVGERFCPAAWGRLVFVPAGGGRLFGSGGLKHRVSLTPTGADELRVAGSGCSLRFVDRGPAALGIRTRILSHRGYTGIYPANTIAAFRDAMAQGFPGFEMDVRLTSDGEAVVAHDDRLFAATRCRGRVSKRPVASVTACEVIYSPWIPEVRMGGKKARRTDYIPTVKAVLKEFLQGEPRVEKIVLDLKVKLGTAGVRKLREAMPPCEPRLCAEWRRRLIFIVLDNHGSDAAELYGAFEGASIALESDDTISGFIDSFPNRPDLWGEGASHDMLSLSFGSVDDPVLRFIKLVILENQRPAHRLHRLVLCNERHPRRKDLLAWTVNSRRGVRRVGRYQPEEVLTDLSYAKFIRLLMRRPMTTAAGPAPDAPVCPISSVSAQEASDIR